MDPTLAAFYRGWHDYQETLITALLPLTDEQLTLRAAPGLRSIGENLRHMIGARARWSTQALGIGSPELAALTTLDRGSLPPITAAELVSTLQTTWQVLRDALDQWSPQEMAAEFQVERGGQSHTFTRQWIVWHLMEHDLHHGGEVSLMLGMHGLVAPDM